MSAPLAQHVAADITGPTVVVALKIRFAQLALLVIRVNIGRQTLVRTLSTEPAQFAQHVLQVNKKQEVVTLNK